MRLLSTARLKSAFCVRVENAISAPLRPSGAQIIGGRQQLSILYHRFERPVLR